MIREVGGRGLPYREAPRMARSLREVTRPEGRFSLSAPVGRAGGMRTGCGGCDGACGDRDAGAVGAAKPTRDTFPSPTTAHLARRHGGHAAGLRVGPRGSTDGSFPRWTAPAAPAADGRVDRSAGLPNPGLDRAHTVEVVGALCQEVLLPLRPPPPTGNPFCDRLCPPEADCTEWVERGTGQVLGWTCLGPGTFLWAPHPARPDFVPIGPYGTCATIGCGPLDAVCIERCKSEIIRPHYATHYALRVCAERRGLELATPLPPLPLPYGPSDGGQAPGSRDG